MPMWMNTWDVDDARDRYRNDPILGPATQTLANLRDAADRNSDGWCYWPKPSRSAAKLMELIEAARSAYRQAPDPPAITVAQVKLAYRPIKAFRTRSGIDFEIVEPGT